ncbi:hypothetical protein [Rhizobium sophoriradicis]|uniref:hypothetical protein n=1 Tax=Rhizobium sophoriradicis TaxID=1535245 RepID=UPI001AECC39B|nr:hypothetical protein [Rhizobium sophoriradicis]
MNKLLTCCVTAVVLSGCADYMNHRDTITFGAGNAMEANKAIHITQPFNPQTLNTRIYADGRRVGRIMKDYNGGGPSEGGQQPYSGNCPTEEDTAADGSRCGGRAASVR